MAETTGKASGGGLHDLAERIRTGISVGQVFGEPVEANGRTLIPVARVAFGFGGGLGASRDAQRFTGVGEDKSAGAGGGGLAAPVGMIEIASEGTRFIPTSPGRWLLAGAVLGLLAGWLVRRCR
ncbi:MAG TPA: spore germination protein GerW family protein [Thermoanaerobaculia bacterium]|nr:spore germination protein GerW family protein [Thermoanaerobaculia bacterium]